MVEYIIANMTPIMLAVLGIAITAIMLIHYVRHVGFEAIRERVYKAFVEAEHEFQYGDNNAKFEYVVNIAKTAIPAPFNLFITESLLRKVVQAWFDLIKDLLDDGQFNNTSIVER